MIVYLDLIIKRGKMPKKLLVVYLDHYHTDTLVPAGNYIMKTVGFYAGQDKNYLHLALNLDDDGSVRTPFMYILKKCIIKKKVC